MVEEVGDTKLKVSKYLVGSSPDTLQGGFLCIQGVSLLFLCAGGVWMLGEAYVALRGWEGCLVPLAVTVPAQVWQFGGHWFLDIVGAFADVDCGLGFALNFSSQSQASSALC